jgi:hypothetical protein
MHSVDNQVAIRVVPLLSELDPDMSPAQPHRGGWDLGQATQEQLSSFPPPAKILTVDVAPAGASRWKLTLRSGSFPVVARLSVDGVQLGGMAVGAGRAERAVELSFGGMHPRRGASLTVKVLGIGEATAELPR